MLIGGGGFIETQVLVSHSLATNIIWFASCFSGFMEFVVLATNLQIQTIYKVLGKR